MRQIISMLANRINSITDELVKATVRKLAETYIGIVAESVREAGLQQERHSRRHIEIVLSFIHLLAERLAVNRSPSYYASLLHISPVYLNEVVKEVTGMSATLYIRNELILQAKRLLVYTGLAVKEVSDRLGIDDYAYFTRIFTQTTGISPTTFRQKNLE
ncbi:helix-turn-helix domain-containing protein [Bacteroides gallinaceum]|uniref:helix-turn-helix domain-containing protein n=1 Tax=Bacteroides gallinaceum TaxID=1462571 RepID=UPI0019590C75|nr:helix-turn-helix domain-containing protein [Bacteroides gallinaceum]MBM6658124.1 AraC family transcriptional regulator [Bacteroides gallinaceum]